MTLTGGTPRELADYIKGQLTKFGKGARATGLRQE